MSWPELPHSSGRFGSESWLAVERFGAVFLPTRAQSLIHSSEQLYEINHTFDGVGVDSGLRLVFPGQGKIAGTAWSVVDLDTSMVSLSDVVLSPFHLK